MGKIIYHIINAMNTKFTDKYINYSYRHDFINSDLNKSNNIILLQNAFVLLYRISIQMLLTNTNLS